MDSSDREPAVGERQDWRDFWLDHSMCGGTWVYINDKANPRVICSCGMTQSQTLTDLH